MRQPSRNGKKKTSVRGCNKQKQVTTLATSKKQSHPKFGTSKLEVDFAHDFLDKLGVKYIWQFEAVDIGRWFDYYLQEHNLIIEINGGYWHGDPRLYEEKDLNRTQKRNQRVDEYKHKWALMHGIPIYYIWEKDIRESPKMVMKQLKERLHMEEEKQVIKENKSKRHINNIKR